MLDTYRRYWDEFVGRMDTDGDGRVTKEEFVASIGTKTIDADEFTRVAAPHFRAVCELADTNNDGSLDRTEYVRLASIYGVNRQDAEAAFEQIDSNHDDTLTVEELITAGWDFYLSEDDTSTGSALFGSH